MNTRFSRKIKYTCTALALALCISLSSQATPFETSSFDYCADALNKLGLFSGTGGGLELDRRPSRAESAVMLVRLLGKSQEAEGQKNAHPFTDVPQWASDYVGWLYKNGLAAGKGENLFGSSDLCTLQMYCTFMLRSLGYSDAKGGDFTFAGAVQFAVSKHLIDSSIGSATFKRNEMAAISYSALALSQKNGTPLFQKLLDDGLLDTQNGKLHADMLSKHNMLISSALNLPENISLEIVEKTPQLENGELSVSQTKRSFTQMVNDGRITQHLTITRGNGDAIEYYYNNGYVYSVATGEMWKDTPFTSTPSNDVFPYYFVRSIELSGASHEIKYFDSLANALGFGKDISADNFGASYTLSQSGELLSRSVYGTAAYGGKSADIGSNIKVLASGSSVKLLMPDFSGYIDLTEHMGK